MSHAEAKPSLNQCPVIPSAASAVTTILAGSREVGRSVLTVIPHVLTLKTREELRLHCKRSGSKAKLAWWDANAGINERWPCFYSDGSALHVPASTK